MFLRLFSSYRPFVLFLIIIIGCSLFFGSFSHPVVTDFSFLKYQMPLYRLIIHLLGTKIYLPLVVTMLFTILMGIYLIRLNAHYIFIPERTYLPALFFFIVAGSYASLNILNPVIFASFFILLAVNRIFSTFKTDSLCYHFFDASFIIAIASLIYFPSIFFIIILWFVLSIMRPFHWREWLYSILGISVVYGLVVALYFLLDKNIIKELIMVKSYFEIPYHLSFSLAQLILYGVIIFIVLLASIYMMRIIPTIKIQARKSFQVWLVFFIISLLLLIIPAVQIEVLILLAIPLAFLFSYYFISFKKIWIGEILFVFLIGLLFLSQYLK